MLSILRDDALSETDDGFALRVSLPWIRSLPVGSLREVGLAIDGTEVDDLAVRRASGDVPVTALPGEPGWWYVQDRVVLTGSVRVAGSHRVELGFRLLVPYLPGGPDTPLVLPFRAERDLVVGAGEPWTGRDVA